MINDIFERLFKSKKLKFPIPYNSEFTVLVSVSMDNLKESSKQHAIFLDSMLKHWNTFNKSNDKVVPIT